MEADSGTGEEQAAPARPFLRGVRDSLGLPAAGLFAALAGYGVLARDAGLDFLLTFVSVVTIWAMPALMAFVELTSAGASPFLVLITLFVINVRNLPMAVSAIPMIRDRPGFRWSQIVMAQLLSPTSWVQISVVGLRLPPTHRMPYYAGFSLMLLTSGLIGAWIGFAHTEGLPRPLGLALLLLTPLFVLFTMATAPRLSSKLALVIGGLMVPQLMVWDPEIGLVLGGVAGGTAGFLLARLPALWARKR